LSKNPETQNTLLKIPENQFFDIELKKENDLIFLIAFCTLQD